MAGATLDHIHLDAGDEPHHLGRFRAHVLRAGMAGEMRGDAALDRLEAGGETFLLRDVDDIFVDVARRGGEAHHVFVFGQDERPFEFEHQAA